jgi:hypothetical protein
MLVATAVTLDDASISEMFTPGLTWNAILLISFDFI